MTKISQERYSINGLLANWDNLTNAADKEYSKRLYDTLQRENILPEDLSGFVFFSTSSNKGSKEIGFAHMLEKSLSNTRINKKPIVIASDIFGTQSQQGNFLPGFDPDKKPIFDNVDFNFLSSNANEIPLTYNSVDVIFDRMGATWHTINDALDNVIKISGKIPNWELTDIEKTILKLLSGHENKLKDHGKIVIDAPKLENPSNGADINTSRDMLIEIFSTDEKMEVALNSIGLTHEYIGNNNDRLLILKKNNPPQQE